MPLLSPHNHKVDHDLARLPRHISHFQSRAEDRGVAKTFCDMAGIEGIDAGAHSGKGAVVHARFPFQ
jgi:hypothetical protein